MSRLPHIHDAVASPFVSRVARFAAAHRLIQKGDRVLVSVSGGPDSVALLAVLVALASPQRLTLSVVHFNHGLRSAESDEDERFVVSLCARMSIPCHCERLDFGAAERIGPSLQQRARERRYAALTRLAEELKAT